MDPTPFGRYRLVELLGRGGMGEVWRAHDTVTDRVVAIKVLPAHLSEDEEFQRRFRREAHAAARLDTPHVVPIYDYGEIDGRLFVSMRLIKGSDLDTVLTGGRLDPARAVRIIDQVAKALHAAHKVGLLHRDIKPSNILLDDDDFAYLIDFGIARVADETRMTKTGNTIGTFAYIAPERLDPHTEEDARADIYSLACVLYEALTGEPPFAGSTTAHLMFAHLSAPPPRPSTTQPAVPAQFDAVIAKGMAKEPDNRYATTVELADAARDAVTEPIARPTPSPPTLPATEQARDHVPAQPMTVKADSPGPTKPAPPRPTPPIPTRAAGISRHTRIALIAGAVVLVAVIAAAVGISALGKHEPSGSPPTPSARSYAAQVVLPFTGLKGPTGVAVDAAGNLYVTDAGNKRVVELAAGSSTQTVLPFTGLNAPGRPAVDTADNLYVVDWGNKRVLKFATGSSTQTVLPFTGLNDPHGLAVDAAGDVYIADTENNWVLKLAPGSNTPTEVPLTGVVRPWALAVDAAGNLYVTVLEHRVWKLEAGSSTPTVLPFTGLTTFIALAVDGARNLYAIENGTNSSDSRVLKLTPGSNTQTQLPFTDLDSPQSVAVDSAGNVYVTDFNHNRVVKLPVQ